VTVEVGGGHSYNGQSVSFDVMEASAKAYVRALNNAAAAGEAARHTVSYKDRREASGAEGAATKAARAAAERATNKKKES
jgi:hypothetical protein